MRITRNYETVPSFASANLRLSKTMSLTEISTLYGAPCASYK
jgi:hypothetical protein